MAHKDEFSALTREALAVLATLLQDADPVVRMEAAKHVLHLAQDKRP